MTEDNNQDWATINLELRMQELLAQRVRAEELFRGYASDLDDDRDDDDS